MSTELQTIPAAGGLMPTSATTPQDLAILQAMQDRRVSQASDQELDRLLNAAINKGLLLLGHKNQLTSTVDQALMVTEVSNMIRQNWHYLTLREVELVFEMGVRGELKTRPDQIVFLNIEQVGSWFQVYRNDRKPKAVQSARKEEPEQAEVDPLAFDEIRIAYLKDQVEKIRESQYRDFDAGDVYSEWLQRIGVIRLTNEEKLQIKFEEAAELIRIARITDLDPASRWELKRFMHSPVMQRNNRYELRLRSLCKKRVLKDFILQVIVDELDIEQLITERLAKTRRKP